ncbi:zinc finger protein 892-like [Phlebotomus papatasi]|uniref:zinc finger protein 892-like n=1 Tax=Phlebotomus papatasi TaxID=29031 RepID=UPI002483E6DD|nr:zinc finger protein 892-like [Phlebotomus papatasi]
MKSVRRKQGVITVEEFDEETICRLCLKLSTSSEMTNIFRNDTKKQLSLRIMACTSLEVTPDDPLPSQICPTCSDFLELFYSFRKKCKSSDLKYRRFLRLQSSGKINSINDLSDDEDDVEYSEVLMKFREKEKNAVEEKLEKVKEELASKYEEEKLTILQEEKRRIYREEKQKIQENAMREIVATLKQKEREEKTKIEPEEAKMQMGTGKVFRIIKKSNESSEDPEDDSVEYEVVMGEEEEDSEKKDYQFNTDVDYTLVSEDEYEIQEEASEATTINQLKEDESHQADYTDYFKSPEVDEVEDFHYLEEDREEYEEPVDMEEDEQDDHENPTTSDFIKKESCDSQSMNVETDEGKVFYLEIEGEEAANKPKYYDSNGDLLIFKCSMCPKTFSRKKGLEKHEISHMKRKGYSCTFCEKWFPSNSSRQRHERIHTGEKPFTCSVCGRKFVQKEILKRHLIVHSAEKPYKCNQCDKQFTQKEILRQHVNRNHSANPVVEVHKCFLCPKTFCHASGLSRHLLVHAGRTFPCDVCRKEFVDKSALKRHINTIHKNTA